MTGRSEETVDRIFAGNLDGLPPLSSKVRLLVSYDKEALRKVNLNLGRLCGFSPAPPSQTC